MAAVPRSRSCAGVGGVYCALLHLRRLELASIANKCCSVASESRTQLTWAIPPTSCAPCVCRASPFPMSLILFGAGVGAGIGAGLGATTGWLLQRAKRADPHGDATAADPLAAEMAALQQEPPVDQFNAGVWAVHVGFSGACTPCTLHPEAGAQGRVCACANVCMAWRLLPCAAHASMHLRRCAGTQHATSLSVFIGRVCAQSHPKTAASRCIPAAIIVCVRLYVCCARCGVQSWAMTWRRWRWKLRWRWR